MGIQYVRSMRGGHMMLYSGYRFNLQRQRIKGSTVWRCVNRSCQGSRIMDSSGFKVLNDIPHTLCKPDYIGNEIYFAFNKCKIRIRDRSADVKTIYHEEFDHLIKRGCKRIPSLQSLYRIYKTTSPNFSP